MVLDRHNHGDRLCGTLTSLTPMSSSQKQYTLTSTLSFLVWCLCFWFYFSSTVRTHQMVNWQTTLAGTLAAIFGYLAHAFPQYESILTAVASMATMALGWVAKDHNVTGGTPMVPATKK